MRFVEYIKINICREKYLSEIHVYGESYAYLANNARTSRKTKFSRLSFADLKKRIRTIRTIGNIGPRPWLVDGVSVD